MVPGLIRLSAKVSDNAIINDPIIPEINQEEFLAYSTDIDGVVINC